MSVIPEPNSISRFASTWSYKLISRAGTENTPKSYFWLHWKNLYFISFKVEKDMIVVTSFLSIMSQMQIHLVQNRKENCHHDHIPFNLKENEILVFSVYEDGKVMCSKLWSPWRRMHACLLLSKCRLILKTCPAKCYASP